MRKLLTLSLLTITCTSYGQDHLELIAREFCQRIGRYYQIERRDLSAAGRTWRGFGRDFVIGVDCARKNVVLWVDSNSSNDPTRPLTSTSEPITESAALGSARQWAISAQIEIPGDVEISKINLAGSQYQYVFVFKERPHGYTARAGNRVTIQVNNFTGKVVGMSRSVGYSYAPPEVLIIDSQAVAAVQRRLTSLYSTGFTLKSVSGPTYGVDTRGDLREGNAPPLGDPKRAFLQYIVVFSSARGEIAGFVDAKTGAVLGGHWSKSSNPSAIGKTKVTELNRFTAGARSRDSRGFPYLVMVSLFLAGAASVVYVWRRYARD